MSFFGKNIKKIRSIKGLSQQAFADLFDLKRGTLGAYEEGRSEPKIETIIKIANYFSISIDSLLKSELTVNELLKFRGDVVTNINKSTGDDFNKIKCITKNNYRDYVELFNDNSFLDNLPELIIPVGSKNELRAFTVNNLEMTSDEIGFYPNDVVIGEKISLDNVSELQNGFLVFVLLENNILLRRIYVLENKITLKADHKSIEDVELNKDSLKEIWKVNYVFFKRVPSVSNFIDEKLFAIEQKIDIINGKISKL